MRVLHVLRVLPAVLLLLSGCVSDDAGPVDPADSDAGPVDDPSDPGQPAPTDEPQAGAGRDEEPFEPLVFEGTVTGAADCGLHGTLGSDPLTPEAIELPPEAARHLYSLEVTSTGTAPGLGATCLLFSDGTHRDSGEAREGRVPPDVEWVQVITNGNVGLEYRLTIR